jgi:hypothetical protein
MEDDAAGQPVPTVGDALEPAPPVSGVAEEQAAAEALRGQHRNGANWFFWIAGLSLVNSVLAVTGASMRFIFGLGITQVADALGGIAEGEGSGIAKAVAFGISLVLAGFVALFGLASLKRIHPLYVLGMVLYFLDGLLMLVFQDWLGAGFHAFVLWGLWRGLAASRQLRRIEAATAHLTGAPIAPR